MRDCLEKQAHVWSTTCAHSLASLAGRRNVPSSLRRDVMRIFLDPSRVVLREVTRDLALLILSTVFAGFENSHCQKPSIFMTWLYKNASFLL